MRKRILIVGLILAAATGSALAQSDESAGTEAVVRGILDAILLPKTTQIAREAGVSEEDISAVIDIARERSLPPGETRTIIDETTTSFREHGPIDNLGAFVKERLDEGLRGRDLAASIRAEHQARGRGRGAAKGQRGQGEGASQGERPEGAGKRPTDNAPDDEPGEEEDENENGKSRQQDKGKKGKGGSL